MVSGGDRVWNESSRTLDARHDANLSALTDKHCIDGCEPTPYRGTRRRKCIEQLTVRPSTRRNPISYEMKPWGHNPRIGNLAGRTCV
jgi:hypothetical protein